MNEIFEMSQKAGQMSFETFQSSRKLVLFAISSGRGVTNEQKNLHGFCSRRTVRRARR